jgi:phosphate-selective porin OprO/OprP
MNGGLKKMSRLLLAGAGAVGLWGIGATGAGAQSAQELQAIQAQIQQMQATIRALEKQVQDAKAQAASAQQAASDSKSDIDLKVKWKGAPEFSSADGKFKMKVRGRLQVDYNGIDQDERITGFPDVSAAELRRARLGVEGVVFYDWKYKFEVDFAGDSSEIKDAYIAYSGLADGLDLIFGNYKTPNSLEELTSSRYITFLERAAFTDAWELDRQIGAGFFYGKEHFTVAAGVFGQFSENQEVWYQDFPKVGSARVTLAPINREVNGVHQVLHFGASWREREQAKDNRELDAFVVDPSEDQLFRYRARPDLHLAQRFVATPEIFDHDTYWNLEAAAVWGSLYAVGEYSQLEGEVDPIFIGADPTYNGWYAEAGWFITGETRPYDEGEWGRVKVKRPVYDGSGGYGAWQIAARYDVLDLSDKALTIPNCEMCGEQKTWLVALNWYPTDYTRVMFNYVNAEIEGGFMNGRNVNNGANIEGFGTRVQVDW